MLVKVRRRFRKDRLKRKFVSICYNALMLLLFGRLEAIDLNGSPKVFSRESYRTTEAYFQVVIQQARATLKSGVEVRIPG
jgi:hypothetical protein